MAVDQDESLQGTCFVVMGFGKKTDFETGRTLDLDKSYKNLIKPAAERAGLKCIRADEIVHSGMIDVPMYEQLLSADVVVADLSTSNTNAFYELGIRHALRPCTTVVISEDGIKKFPFDVSHVAVRQYHHLGEDIGFDEAQRFSDLLTKSIREILSARPRPSDSPIYTVLDGLVPPSIAKEIRAAAEARPAAPETTAPDAADIAQATHSALMQQVEYAQMQGDFVTAKSLLAAMREMMKPHSSAGDGADPSVVQRDAVREDPSIIQRLALVTYKSEYPTREAALQEASKLLTTLAPETTNDPETLGLWGAVHKRLWVLTRNPADLDVAIHAYARGFYVRHDHYNGINLAYLLNVRALNTSDRAEAIADYVQAQRIRRKVIDVCERWLDAEASKPGEASGYLKQKTYWVKASIAEAYVGIGDDARGQAALKEALAIVPAKWMQESTETQITKLRDLLANSPLKYINTDA
jgi:tetratricopeptide repeat protein